MARRPLIAVLAVLAALIVIVIPAMAASPKPVPPGQANKEAKEPKVSITVTGTVAASTAAGASTYTLRSGGTTYTLDAGPGWFFGNNHPLKGFVGQSVTIVGERAEGSTEIDVLTVNGTALREAGKPPWAGGWKQVGKRHPGWSQAKADRLEAKFGDCFPPGHCKEDAPAPTP